MMFMTHRARVPETAAESACSAPRRLADDERRLGGDPRQHARDDLQRAR